jgi:precorrin-6B methylase 2
MGKENRVRVLKTKLKNFVQRTAWNPIAWWVYRTCGWLSVHFGRIYGHAQFVRQSAERDGMIARVTAEIFPDLTVAYGPFKGLRYPSARSFASALLPKLLGSYESELHPVLDELLTNAYNTVIDIGCAEGYYAIGFALRLRQAAVYAFDTDSRAKELCVEMAKLNGVADRIHIGDFCDEEILRSIPLGERALILSDCEGYEGLLFNRKMAEFLARHDLIIEAHDFIDIELSTKMRDAFAQTHYIRSIKSMDDIGRAHASRYRELERYSTRDKCLILSERRPAIMEWLVMTSKEEKAAVRTLNSEEQMRGRSERSTFRAGNLQE